jgi:predicted secreted protein
MRILGIALLTTAALTVMAGPAAAKTFRESDSGASVKIKQGKTFKVRLDQAFDGGYAWSKAKPKDQSVVKLVRKRTLPGECATIPYCVGGTNIFVATYRAVAPGKTKLRLVQRQSFGDGDVLGRFKLDVTVKK